MKKERLLLDKIEFTIIYISLYIIGRMIPLYGVESTVAEVGNYDAQTFFVQAMSGDVSQKSIMALGIMPSMWAGILVQIVLACRSKNAKAKSPASLQSALTAISTLAIAVIQSYTRVTTLTFNVDGDMLLWTKWIAGLQLVSGAFVITWLVSRIKMYGIGGQSLIIYINIIDSLMKNILQVEQRYVMMCFLIALPTMFIMMVMESTEKRIPMQRISIHNIYGDKNYLAIKMNPIGAMPIMFASIAFMLPRAIVQILYKLKPSSYQIEWMQENMILTKPFGIEIYLVTLVLLTVFFAFVFVNPWDLAENLQKSGDSIIGLHPGKETRRYLFWNVLLISLFSAGVMCICMGVPMVLQIRGTIDKSIAMIPTSFMILSGLGCSIYLEAQAVYSLDTYKSFL